MEERISGHTGLLALIGSPVGHSGSPAMYNYSFAKLGLDYAYVAFDVKEDQVKEALDAVKLFHMRGINVTMPDKTEAAKYVDELSPAAQIIGAVNTIVNDDGRLTGYITDGEGFVHNLKDHGVDIKGKKITVAGGGGAATAIQVQCALDGAREITIFNIKDAFFERTLQTAEKIRKAVPGIVVNVYDIADTAKMTEEITSSDIFANATIVGMKPEDALKHPNWNMGAKVTIDSSTLVNKGLEVMEAKWLFGTDNIKVLVHRQSVVHSMVEFVDNGVIAQLGAPDMRLPIQYALTYPNRLPMKNNELDFTKYPSLTFDEPDTDTFYALKLAYDALKDGGIKPTVFNSADEAAVELFMQGKISYLGISDAIAKAMSEIKNIENPTISDIWETDKLAREIVYRLEKESLI